MIDKKVTFTDTNIHYTDNPNRIVMDKISKPLMEAYSHIVCQNGGIVLDVGFGMGFSANKMYELADHYHCIEINDQIYDKLVEWAADKPNVTVWYGDWKEIIPQLQIKFDGIFMDTYDDPNYSEFEDYCKSISKEGTVLSIFNYFEIRNTENLHTKVFMVNENYENAIEPFHEINWTYFENGEFVKSKKPRINKLPTNVI